jgi:hypothetical protein
MKCSKWYGDMLINWRLLQEKSIVCNEVVHSEENVGGHVFTIASSRGFLLA